MVAYSRALEGSDQYAQQHAAIEPANAVVIPLQRISTWHIYGINRETSQASCDDVKGKHALLPSTDCPE